MGTTRRVHYSPRGGDCICEAIASGSTLEKALKGMGMLAPSMKQVWEWLDKFPEFAEKYERARRLQADMLADKMLEFAEDVLLRPKMAPAYRVAADILKTQTECRNPARYGAKITHEIVPTLSSEKIKDEIRRLEADLGISSPALPPNVVRLIGSESIVDQPIEKPKKTVSPERRKALMEQLARGRAKAAANKEARNDPPPPSYGSPPNVGRPIAPGDQAVGGDPAGSDTEASWRSQGGGEEEVSNVQF